MIGTHTQELAWKNSFLERLGCPVCGHGQSTEYYSRPYADGEVRDFLFRYYCLDDLFTLDGWLAKVGDTPYVLCECNRCRALYQKYVPDEAFSLEIYSKWIGRHRSGWPRYELEEYVHWMTEAMELSNLVLRKTALSFPSEIRVLDFGMGHGLFLRAMAACGSQVWGYDLAENRQSAVAESGIATVALDDIGRMRFDFINTEQVFEHLPDPAHIGALLASALAPGGILKISVPFSKWLEQGDLLIDWKSARYAKHSPMPLHPLEHLNYYRRSSIKALAANLGLKHVGQEFSDLLRYAVGWTSPRRTLRNIGRALVRDRVRNYHLLQKPMMIGETWSQ